MQKDLVKLRFTEEVCEASVSTASAIAWAGDSAIAAWALGVTGRSAATASEKPAEQHKSRQHDAK